MKKDKNYNDMSNYRFWSVSDEIAVWFGVILASIWIYALIATNF